MAMRVHESRDGDDPSDLRLRDGTHRTVPTAGVSTVA
jgi:hypothetical protein